MKNYTFKLKIKSQNDEIDEDCITHYCQMLKSELNRIYIKYNNFNKEYFAV